MLSSKLFGFVGEFSGDIARMKGDFIWSSGANVWLDAVGCCASKLGEDDGDELSESDMI